MDMSDPFKMQPNQDKIPYEHLVDAADLGWRKYLLSIFTILLLVWTFFKTENSATLLGLYPTMGGFVLTVVGMYFGANLATKVQGGVINLRSEGQNPISVDSIDTTKEEPRPKEETKPDEAK